MDISNKKAVRKAGLGKSGPTPRFPEVRGLPVSIAVGLIFVTLSGGALVGLGSGVSGPREANRSINAASAGQTGNPGSISKHNGTPGFPDIPTLAKVCQSNNTKDWVSVSDFCHYLLFYGCGPTDLPGYPTGELVLKALTDEETAIRTFGASPFVRTRNGLRYTLAADLTSHGAIGEVHRDQCLATFAELGLPLNTSIRHQSRSYSLADLLSESLAAFDPNEREPAWTAMAYAVYLPPKKEWTNKFKERTSFSQLVKRLLSIDLQTQSCAGTHILQALAKIDAADHVCSIVDEETRKQLDAHLRAVLKEIVNRQTADGSWDKEWCDSTSKNGIVTTLELRDRVLVTGHMLEVLGSLCAYRRPAVAVYVRAAEWTRQTLNSPEFHADTTCICPFTHASRTARRILTPVSADAAGSSNNFRSISSGAER